MINDWKMNFVQTKKINFNESNKIFKLKIQYYLNMFENKVEAKALEAFQTVN